ncbi:MAG: signal peptidase II [Leptolyngbya sp. BL-A-14]
MFFKNRFFWIAAVVGLALDRLTKILFVTYIFPPLPGYSIPVIPGVFHFTYALNPGAAFSIFPGGAVWLRWLSLGVSLALMGLAWSKRFTLNRWEQVGYGFILSGALGNGIDRFLVGEVIDFLDFRLINFPVFNVADSFINIGIACLLIASFSRSPTSERETNQK